PGCCSPRRTTGDHLAASSPPNSSSADDPRTGSSLSASDASVQILQHSQQELVVPVHGLVEGIVHRLSEDRCVRHVRLSLLVLSLPERAGPAPLPPRSPHPPCLLHG